MCPDSLNLALWVRFHGRYWYQSFIDGSNIWGVDRTDPWGPGMDHLPLGRSYLVVVPSYDMSCALILLTGLYGWDFMVVESSCYMAVIIITWKINSSAAAKYELYILLPAEQRCSKKCIAALQADTFVYLYTKYIYIYLYIYIWKPFGIICALVWSFFSRPWGIRYMAFCLGSDICGQTQGWFCRSWYIEATWWHSSLGLS